jgi:hypothetical protein
MLKKNMLLGGLCVTLAGCVTTSTGVSSSAPREVQRFQAFNQCVDGVANPAIKSGTAIPTAVNRGMQACGSELSRYVDALIDKTKRHHGWSSVDPSVKPAVQAKVVSTTTAAMIKKYREIY